MKKAEIFMVWLMTNDSNGTTFPPLTSTHAPHLTPLQQDGVDYLMAERKVFEIGSGAPFITQLYASFQTEVLLV
jgi:hypothetical protein